MSITSSNTNRNCTKLRIVFLGDQGVGKSSIIDRYTTNRYDQQHTPTVGIDFNVRDITRNNHVYRLQMWDTAGQERYRSLIPTYLKNAHCVIFIYDITKISSLQNVRSWQKMFAQNQQAPGILVGNKIDLTTGRKVTKEQGQKLATELHLKYDQVSAKTGKKVNQLFEDILDIILDERQKQQQLIESSRGKMKDLRTIIENGVQEQPKNQQNQKEKPITLQAKGLQLIRNLKCCNSS